MKKILLQNKLVISIGLLVIGVFATYYITGMDENETSIENTDEWFEEETLSFDETDARQSVEEEKIIVDVKGAIHIPGVYECQLGDRVVDVIERAGGLHENADQNSVNLAMKLEDEMVLYFPVVGEERSEAVGGGMTFEKDDGKVNINKATATELQTLTGIGPSKADDIIEYREKNGPFKTVEEITEISGIGEKTFEKLKDGISVR